MAGRGEMKDEAKSKKQLIAELTGLRRQAAELSQRITELETAESQHLLESELLRIFRSATPIGLFIVQDGEFQFVNDIFRGIAGGKPDELIGTPSMNLVLPEDREFVAQKWQARHDARSATHEMMLSPKTLCGHHYPYKTPSSN